MGGLTGRGAQGEVKVKLTEEPITLPIALQARHHNTVSTHTEGAGGRQEGESQ